LLQNCAILRNAARTSLPLVGSEKHAAQRREKLRKKSLLNYESPALTAELQAPRALTREHPTSNLQRPMFKTTAFLISILDRRFAIVGLCHVSGSLF
jgi:hypothetical protein